jgi:hypothetical protein
MPALELCRNRYVSASLAEAGADVKPGKARITP